MCFGDDTITVPRYRNTFVRRKKEMVHLHIYYVFLFEDII